MYLDGTKQIYLDYPEPLYYGCLDSAKVFLSIRMALLYVIAESSLQPNLKKPLEQLFETFHKRELDYHKDNPTAFWRAIITDPTSIDELKWLRVYDHVYSADPNNNHHIIPRWWFNWMNFSQGKWKYKSVILQWLKDEATRTLLKNYQLPGFHQYNKWFHGMLRWTNHIDNQLSISIERHNNGLNRRYFGTCLPQTQLYLERYATNGDYRRSMLDEIPDIIKELSTILQLPLNEFHNPQCYEMVFHKKNRDKRNGNGNWAIKKNQNWKQY